MHNRSETPWLDWLDWLVPPPRSCIGHYLASVQTMLYTVIQHVCFFLCLPFFMQARPSIAVSPGVAHTARYRIRYCDRKLDARLYPNRRSRSLFFGTSLSWTGMSKKLQNASFFFSKTPASQTIQIPTSPTPTSRLKIVKCEFRHYDFVNAARLVVSIERNAARCKGISKAVVEYLLDATNQDSCRHEKLGTTTATTYLHCSHRSHNRSSTVTCLDSTQLLCDTRALSSPRVVLLNSISLECSKLIIRESGAHFCHVLLPLLSM